MRKTNLRKLINSISKENFNNFKAAVEKHTEEGEVVKKLYEKWTKRPIPENKPYVITITFGDRNLYVTSEDKDEYISVKMREGFVDENNHSYYVNTDCVVPFDDDVMKTILHYSKHLTYRNYPNIKNSPIVTDYIESKALLYDVELDNETYQKLVNLVESL
jgi:hypothetical protein